MLTVRPINRKDYPLSVPFQEVSMKMSSGQNGDTLDVNNQGIFDDLERRLQASKSKTDLPSENLATFVKEGFINLPVPVMNMYAVGYRAAVFTKILSRELRAGSTFNEKYVRQEGKTMAGILSGDIIYSRSEKRYISISEEDIGQDQFDFEDYVIGVQHIKDLVTPGGPEALDFNQETIMFLMSQLPKAIGAGLSNKKVFNEIKNFGTIVRSVENRADLVWVADQYYFAPSQELVVYLQSQSTISNVKNYIIKRMGEFRDSIFDGAMPTFTALLAARDDLENGIGRFSDLLLTSIVVMPLSFRPSIGNRKDPLTVLYDRIFTAANALRSELETKGLSVGTVKTKYISMVNEVNTLFLGKGDDNFLRSHKQFKSLSETLKGKKGLIRGNMQSGRVDYSGRSVITVNPNLSINEVGIPRDMMKRMAELRILDNKNKLDPEGKQAIHSYLTEAINRDKAGSEAADVTNKLLEGQRVIIGRQPTLYYLSIKGFKVRLVDDGAIQMNPLSTPSYNADFDGDTMWVTLPITDEAIAEVDNLMDSEKNLYLPRNGECHIGPRHEILHGLYKAWFTKEPGHTDGVIRKVNISAPSEFLRYQACYDAVINQTLNVYDIVELVNGSSGVQVTGEVARETAREFKGYTAGQIAVKFCLYDSTEHYEQIRIGVSPITRDTSIPETGIKKEDWCKECIKHIALRKPSMFSVVVDKMVKLGFAVSNIWSPSISINEYKNMSSSIKDFDDTIKNDEELYYRGFKSDEDYNMDYSLKLSKFEKSIEKEVYKNLSNTNGFKEMVDSGARGKKSNLTQLFGMKGRMKKNAAESFSAIVEHPMASQLTGLEHYITAYGARQGLAEKSKDTASPGYLARLINHASSSVVVSADDCGTDEGIDITFSFMRQFMPESARTGSEELDNVHIRAVVSKLLVGRYIVGRDSMIKTLKEAEDLYDEMIAIPKPFKRVPKGKITLRSPLTCKCPVCVKCYGVDLGNCHEVAKGTPIGFVAAESISEPGTQLTMKNFQNGGIAGVKNLTSSFDTMQSYMNMVHSNTKSATDPIDYDPLSPVTGYLKPRSNGDGTIQLIFYSDEACTQKITTPKYYMYEGTKLKTFVKQGENCQAEQGNLNIYQLMKYRGVEYARKYLAFFLFELFRRESDVNIKHFEVLVSGMTMYLCAKGDDKYFKTGCYYTRAEYFKNGGTSNGAQFMLRLYGAKDVPFRKNDVISSISLQDISKGLSRSLIVSGEESLNDPIVRTAFGLSLGMGTDLNPNYLSERGGTPIIVDGTDPNIIQCE